METYDSTTRWQKQIYKERLSVSLSSRFLLRFHATLILIFAIGIGWAIDVILLRLGLEILAVRYTLAILAAYGAFLFGVYVWIEYSGIREYLNEQKIGALVGDEVPPNGKTANGGSAVQDVLNTPLWPAFGESFVLGLLFILGSFVVFYFFGGMVLTHAATFFAEIVIELVLAAGLLRGLHRVESSGWVLGVWRSTWPSLAFSLIVAWFAAAFIYANVPSAKSIPDAWRKWGTVEQRS